MHSFGSPESSCWFLNPKWAKHAAAQKHGSEGLISAAEASLLQEYQDDEPMKHCRHDTETQQQWDSQAHDLKKRKKNEVDEFLKEKEERMLKQKRGDLFPAQKVLQRAALNTRTLASQTKEKQLTESPAEIKTKLVKRLFTSLNSSGTGSIDAKEMRAFARLTGFAGDDEEWKKTFRQMCSDTGADAMSGLSFEHFAKLFDDVPYEDVAGFCDELASTHQKQVDEGAQPSTSSAASAAAKAPVSTLAGLGGYSSDPEESEESDDEAKSSLAVGNFVPVQQDDDD